MKVWLLAMLFAASFILIGCDDDSSQQRPETPKERLAKAKLENPPKRPLKAPEDAMEFLSNLEEDEQ